MFKMDTAGMIVPVLCDTFEYDNNYKKIIIKLKDSVRFSNGEKITPFNIVNGWSRLISSDLYSLKPLFRNVKGFNEVLEGKTYFW